MKKKWWIIATALIAGCIGLVLGVLALLPPRPGVTKENFDRIEEGMSRAKVEEVFGGPPKKFHAPIDKAVSYLMRDVEWQSAEEWESESGDAAFILFDENGRVERSLWDGWPDDRTVLEKLLDRMPWREKPARFRSIKIK
jgi:hypothetical protein